MITRPRFRPHLHVRVVDSDRVFLVGEGRHFVLSGRPYVAVANLVDGRRTTDAIVEALAPDLAITDIYLALLTLEKHGHLEEAQLPGPDLPALSRGGRAFWGSLGVEPRTLIERLASRSACVLEIGEVPVEAARSAIADLHIRSTQDPAAADAWLVLTDDASRDGLADIDRRARAAGRPWLLCRPNGMFPWIGPLFVPGITGCWVCLDQRLRANQEVETYLGGIEAGPEADPGRAAGTGLADAAGWSATRRALFPPRAALTALVQAAVLLAVLELGRWLVTGESVVMGKVMTLDGYALRPQEHVLTRRPQCPACGNPRLMTDRPPEIRLESRPKTFVADGGHRAATPQEMLRRYEHHISPITGVAKSLVRITDPTDPLQHVYIAGSNMATRHDSLERLRKHLRASNCGKGTTDEQARASGLGEAIERYSGVFRGDEPRVRGSLRSLGDRAIDPRACMLYSEAQYRDRDLWNAQDRRLDAIPLPFDVTAELEWTPLWSMTRREVRYLPTSYLFYSHPGRHDQFYCLPDSNGNAAGSSLEDAILQGFLELVERDAVAVWWYNRLRRPAVDLDRIDDPYVRSLRRFHGESGRVLWVLDLTGDLGIPVMIALSRRLEPRRDGALDIVFAPASHLDARVCLLRALTELNQMMPGIEPGPDGTGYAYDDPEAVHWWRTATLTEQPYLAPADEPARDLASHPRRWSDDLREDVLLCQSIAEERGLEMLVLDQTRPDIGMPVVKVVVPGLRHFWARFAPGRLYDVPVAMGWLDRPIAEAGLNPVPVFI